MLIPLSLVKFLLLRKLLLLDDFVSTSSNSSSPLTRLAESGRQFFPLVPLITGGLSVTTILNSIWIVAIVSVLGVTGLAAGLMFVKAFKLFQQFEGLIHGNCLDLYSKKKRLFLNLSYDFSTIYTSTTSACSRISTTILSFP